MPRPHQHFHLSQEVERIGYPPRSNRAHGYSTVRENLFPRTVVTPHGGKDCAG